MGTAVLRSHDCLKDRMHLDIFGSRPPPPPIKPSRKKPARSPPSSPPPRNPGRSNPARSNPNRPNRKLGYSPDKENAGDPLLRSRPKIIMMEEVRVLKRGEELKPFLRSPTAANAGDDLMLCSTNQLGPDPKILPKFSDLGSVFAGPAFISSPSPSSLPLPGFLFKKISNEAVKSDIATKGLRCLLRLDNMM